MKPLSLLVRQLVLLAVLLFIVIPMLFVTIERNYYQSTVAASEQTLKAFMYSLLAELDYDNEQQRLILPENVLAPELNQVGSGYSAFITNGEDYVWRSDSSLMQRRLPFNTKLTTGQLHFERFESNTEMYWQLSMRVEFEDGEQIRPLVIHIMQDEIILDAKLEDFKATAKVWFNYLAITFVLFMALSLFFMLKPLYRLDEEIQSIEQGKASRLVNSYPRELRVVSEDLNLLLEGQERQKERYRAHLSDLAHALKTPLSVLRTSPLADNPDTKEQLDRIAHMIERQLKRAASGGDDVWKKRASVHEPLSKLINAMQKIYRHKDLDIELQCPADANFLGDETDFMEIFGNIIDNGCKAAAQKLRINITQHNGLSVTIEDDGPGIKAEHREKLLTRGARLDTYEQGHGVGMAIVNDLVKSYKGTMVIDDSELGGARFHVHFDN